MVGLPAKGSGVAAPPLGPEPPLGGVAEPPLAGPDGRAGVVALAGSVTTAEVQRAQRCRRQGRTR